MTFTERDIAEREQLNRELTLARELALAIGTAETVDHAMAVTLGQICNTTGWVLGEAWVIQGEQLMLSSVWNEGPEDLDRFAHGLTGTTVPLGTGLPGQAWSTRKPVWMRDVTSDPRFLRAPLARKLGLAAGMAVPVLSGHVVVAVLVFFVTEPREEDEHLINLVSGVSAQLGSLVRRKQAEEAHRRSEEQLRSIADTAVDAIVSADAKGTITYVNSAAEQIFGFSYTDLMGKPIKTLMPERFHPAHDRGFARFLETGEKHIIGKRVELVGRHKDGHEFPVEIALANWSAGGETFFTGVLRDITERRQAEESMRQSDQLKTALLRSVSHDLRSPLTAIVAAGESSASPSLSADGRREVASVIVNEAARLSRLVDKLLDLSRLQGGAAAPRQVACSIEEIIQVALEQTTGEDQFELDVEEQLPAVLADATQLERAFANLFENAVRFSGGEPVKVGASVLDGCLVVTIADRGPGIPAEDLDRIFEPFYRRADDSGTHHGSGLGLAIVKGFIEANGGSVRVDSPSGRGSTFSVQLPIQRPGTGVDSTEV